MVSSVDRKEMKRLIKEVVEAAASISQGAGIHRPRQRRDGRHELRAQGAANDFVKDRNDIQLIQSREEKIV